MRVVFLCPSNPERITGGIKMSYRHCEELQESGVDAAVWQPRGRPTWMQTKVKPLADRDFAAKAGDILFFAEDLVPHLKPFRSPDGPVTNVLFCQAQYYIFNPLLVGKTHYDLGFNRVACCSKAAQTFLHRVFGYANVPIIPCSVDMERFRPLAKKLQIAVILRKLPHHYGLIRQIFHRRFPALRDVPWVEINKEHEDVAARVLGESAFFLSLSFLESFGLTPLEAMASECAVIGFHGYGGLEYATRENGIWFWNDQVQEVSEAMGKAILDYRSDGEKYAQMIAAGAKTVARYSREHARRALLDFLNDVATHPRDRTI